MNRYFVLYHLRTAAFVLVVTVAILAVWYVQRQTAQNLRHTQTVTAEKLRQAQLDSCARGNVLRAQVNAEARIVRYFMLAAAAARRHAGKPADLAAASRYEAFAASIAPVNLPDCGHVIPEVGG